MQRKFLKLSGLQNSFLLEGQWPSRAFDCLSCADECELPAVPWPGLLCPAIPGMCIAAGVCAVPLMCFCMSGFTVSAWKSCGGKESKVFLCCVLCSHSVLDPPGFSRISALRFSGSLVT